MKVLLTTIAIGDNYRRAYEDIFKESHEAYATKHGYDFKIITDYLDTLNPEHHHKDAISLNKLLLCSQESEYDMIIYVDADILININKDMCIEYFKKFKLDSKINFIFHLNCEECLNKNCGTLFCTSCLDHQAKQTNEK
jgi:aspartate carbamoyltransferase regulatory subunit